MRPRQLLLAPVAGDPHTQGLFRAARAARSAGLGAAVLPPRTTLEELATAVGRDDPDYLGLSYRMSPDVGVRELGGALGFLDERGLLRRRDGRPRKVAIAGLGETLRALTQSPDLLPCTATLIPEEGDRLAGLRRLLRFLDVPATELEVALARTARELDPPRIGPLDELAREVVASGYEDEPPLCPPSAAGRASLITRLREAGRPLLRVHFGVAAPTIAETVEGVRELALAGVIDELSLGSSDLSQRYFGHPEAFEGRKNDGGVPYRTPLELATLVAAAHAGNYPALKPYAHVVDLVSFVGTCVEAGMLVGAHQAVPLFWFNELDGRGPTSVPASIREHLEAVRELARRGLPVEMNDPNQWSSRWAHDTVVCADYGLICAAMLSCGVRDILLQLQVNKPRETGDYADLAKMTAALDLAGALAGAAPQPPRLWRETRAGIDAFPPELGPARVQLARSTLLQLLLEPHVLHVVPACEALWAARPADVIDASRLVRRAVRVFERHRAELLPYRAAPEVRARREHLVSEATILLRAIADGDPRPGATRVPPSAPLAALRSTLAAPEVLVAALERGLMAAPGITAARYPAASALTTGPGEEGGFDCLDPESGARLSEAARLGLPPR